MRAREFIMEAAWDGMISRLVREYPQQENTTQAMVQWARRTLKKQDRIVWFLKQLENSYQSGNDTNAIVLSRQLDHFMAIQYQPLHNYQFGKQTPEQLISDLRKLEEKYKVTVRKADAVKLQPGDRVIKDWGNGMQWIYTNRAFCPDEGRSGAHCGNVQGQVEPDQRIISLRKHGQVELTFILHADGRLGEMKARHNTKPVAALHPYILWLLEQPFIKGIKGGGYAPGSNFSVRDLSPDDLNALRKARPDLDLDSDLYQHVLDISQQNKSIVQDITQAIDEILLEQTGHSFFQSSSEYGNSSLYEFIEYADYQADYNDGEPLKFSEIPYLMGMILDLGEFDYPPPEIIAEQSNILNGFQVTAKIDREKRSGSWTLSLGDEPVKTGRFRF